jgi:general secretion pathway protein M
VSASYDSGASRASIASLRAQASARWSTMSAKERLGVTLALLLVGVALLWMIAVQPALRTLSDAPQRMEQLDAQWQHMQRLAAEARELRSATPVTASQVSQALESATDRLGGRGRIAVQGDRATLTITAGITGEALRGWLAEARSGARARPLEMRLTRGPEGYTGTLVVTVGGRG